MREWRSRCRTVAFALAGALAASQVSAITVTNTADGGAGSLRAAIAAANAGGVAASIGFNISGCGGVCTISLASPLPNVTVPVTIDGYTQPGASANTLVVGNDAVILISLNVNGSNTNGLSFSSGAVNSVVRGMNIVNFAGSPGGIGILILADGVVVEGNFIGVTPTGDSPAIGGALGINLFRPKNVRIGGTAPAQRNIIGSCGAAIRVESAGTGTVIQGNYLGTNAAGTASISNGAGIAMGANPGASIGDVTIGGIAAGAGNLISGSGSNAVEVTAFEPPTSTIGPVTIQGNTIGLTADGTTALPNSGDGILLLRQGASTLGPVLIGGASSAARNVISSSGNGIHVVGATGVTIQGNFIGTNALGTYVIGNRGWGISIDGNGSFFGTTQIGGTAPGAGNVVAGGDFGGVSVQLTTATIEGNFIGVSANGAPLGNKMGVLVDSADAAIGGTSSAQRNLIAFNNGTGVSVQITTPGVRDASKATILGNSIFNNAGLGIDLGEDGVTPDDPGDGDSGPNGRQNFPILTAASISGGQAVVSGTLDSVPNQIYRIEWFASTTCDPSGNGEGSVFLSGGDYLTDGSGHAVFNGVIFPIPPGYPIITATATDPNGNTSEFSPCLVATGSASFHTLSPCRIADTRNSAGPYGGPALSANTGRVFVIAGQCGVPVGATAVSLNLAVTQPSATGDLRVYPAGASLPLVSAINWGAGKTRSNNAVISLGPNGDVVVYVDQPFGAVDFILDTNGYFQ